MPFVCAAASLYIPPHLISVRTEPLIPRCICRSPRKLLSTLYHSRKKYPPRTPSTLGPHISPANFSYFPHNEPQLLCLSHAGPDKESIAIPLYERLRERNILAFLDREGLHVGDNGPA